MNLRVKNRSVSFFLAEALALALLVFGGLSSFAAESAWTPLVYSSDNQGLLENPLKGLVPWANKSAEFPHSMEWFYIKLNEVMTGPAQFDWSALEAKLNAIASRGNQAIFRFYVDYPNHPTGIPQFLLAAGLQTFPYADSGNKVSVAPDYSDPRLLQAFADFIAALGKRYDGEARIGFIEAGLYGFWGEWHVHHHPTAGEPKGWHISQKSKDAILKNYVNAFHKTLVMVRYPDVTTDSHLKTAFGYHDDSIAKDSIGGQDWFFWPKIIHAGLSDIWQTRPIGGEMYPALAKTVWDSYPKTEDQNLEACIKSIHLTWLCNSEAFQKTLNESQRAKALQAHRLMGYELHVSAVKLDRAADGKLTVSVEIENRGRAPFYYDWNVELGLADKQQHLMARFSTPWQLTSILPGKTVRWSTTLPETSDKEANVLMHVVSPLSNGKPLCFANAEQDKTLRGWLTLSPESTSK